MILPRGPTRRGVRPFPQARRATQLTGGSAALQVLDAAGTQVYSRSLTDNGTFETNAGTAGGWRVRVALTNARGTVNFRVQMCP